MRAARRAPGRTGRRLSERLPNRGGEALAIPGPYSGELEGHVETSRSPLGQRVDPGNDRLAPHARAIDEKDFEAERYVLGGSFVREHPDPAERVVTRRPPSLKPAGEP